MKAQNKTLVAVWLITVFVSALTGVLGAGLSWLISGTGQQYDSAFALGMAFTCLAAQGIPYAFRMGMQFRAEGESAGDGE